MHTKYLTFGLILGAILQTTPAALAQSAAGSGGSNAGRGGDGFGCASGTT